MRRALLLLPLLGTACYPIHKTLQRESSALVSDSNGLPLAGASVALISSAYPYGFEKSRQVHITDVTGQTGFAAVREWRMEVLMIHGAEFFFWNWCIEKEGFETFRTQWRNADDFIAELAVHLRAGESTPCAPSER